jgi:hypothetical protein
MSVTMGIRDKLRPSQAQGKQKPPGGERSRVLQEQAEEAEAEGNLFA